MQTWCEGDQTNSSKRMDLFTQLMKEGDAMGAMRRNVDPSVSVILCPRCSGHIAPDHVFDGGRWWPVWRCVNCGYYRFPNVRSADQRSRLGENREV